MEGESPQWYSLSSLIRERFNAACSTLDTLFYLVCLMDIKPPEYYHVIDMCNLYTYSRMKGTLEDSIALEYILAVDQLYQVVQPEFVEEDFSGVELLVKGL